MHIIYTWFIILFTSNMLESQMEPTLYMYTLHHHFQGSCMHCSSGLLFIKRQGSLSLSRWFVCLQTVLPIIKVQWYTSTKLRNGISIQDCHINMHSNTLITCFLPFSGSNLIHNDILAEVDEMCDPPCENGVCAANNTCHCDAGYQGERCTEEGRFCNWIKFFQAPRCIHETIRS